MLVLFFGNYILDHMTTDRQNFSGDQLPFPPPTAPVLCLPGGMSELTLLCPSDFRVLTDRSLTKSGVN